MNYTTEQKSIVNYEGDELLVRGVAGSGKTISILANAIKKSSDRPSILFITFNKALNQKIESLCGNDFKGNIEIKNFHSWAYGEVTRIFGRPNKPLWDREKKELIKISVQAVGREYNNRFINTTDDNLEFLGEEFNFIKGKNLCLKSEYSVVERIGRGNKVRISSKSVDRDIIYEIYKEFERNKKLRNRFEFIDFGFDLYKRVDDVTHYDYVYIDEAQDLNQVELQLLRKIAEKGFYVCADDGQKIYRTSYTWSEIGANFKGGRTKRLSKSFRSTYEIFKFASELQKNDTSLKGENYVQPEFDESILGIKPSVIDCDNSILRDGELVKRIRDYLKKNPEGKIGVLCIDRNLSDEINSLLTRAGIDTFLQSGNGIIDFKKNVLITTIHSSKGLEFDYVIIPEFNEDSTMSIEEKDEEVWNNRRKLWYVAFSRARCKLDVMYYRKSNALLKEINKELYTKVEL